MENDQILIVEDELKLASLLADYLQNAQYQTYCINEGLSVVDWVKTHQPSAIILDIMLPGKDGMEICREIRTFSDVPILMLTARVEEIDRLLGLELGADDYICKPFSPREVVARVKAVLRRVKPSERAENKLALNEGKFEVCYGTNSLSLTAVEFQLLLPLYREPGRIFSRDQLMNCMYADHRIVSDRTIDSHVKKLRKKLATISDQKDLIHSVYGVGYKLVLD
ncbi:response regulator [Thalassotalea fusca]